MSDNYLNDSDFLLLIFEIFVDLLLTIGVIYRRKYELLSNLKINFNVYENCMKIM